MGQTFAVPINTSTSIASSVSDVSTALATLQSSFSGATAPTTPSPVAGQQFFDTDTKALEVYDGASWRSQSGRIGEVTTAVGNVGTGEDVLQSVTIPAGVLAVDGQRVVIAALFVFAANANAKTAKLVFGATTLATVTSIASNAETILVEATVFRTGAATQTAIVRTTQDETTTLVTVAKVTATETLSGTVTVETRGEGTSNDDVLGEVLVVECRV